VRGSVVGPWRIIEPIDTTTGTPAGPVLMSASVPSKAATTSASGCATT